MNKENENDKNNDIAFIEENALDILESGAEMEAPGEDDKIKKQAKQTATDILIAREEKEKERDRLQSESIKKMDKLINCVYYGGLIFGIILLIVAVVSFTNGATMQGLIAGISGVLAMVIKELLAIFKIKLPDGSIEKYVEDIANKHIKGAEIEETNTSITYKVPK